MNNSLCDGFKKIKDLSTANVMYIILYEFHSFNF